MTVALLTTTEFDAILDSFGGQQVTLNVATVTNSGYSGKPSISYGGNTSIKACFIRPGTSWTPEKAAFIEKGDAVMVTAATNGVKKDDKITVGSKVYLVREVFDVQGTFDSTGSGTANLFTQCNLFLDS